VHRRVACLWHQRVVALIRIFIVEETHVESE